MDDGSERALARYRVTLRDGTCAETVVALPPAQIEQPASTDRNHTTQDIARVADLMLDLDTLEGRAVRAEQAATVALAKLNAYLDNLLDERRSNPGDDLVSALVVAEV